MTSAERTARWVKDNPERRAGHCKTYYETKGRDRWLRSNYGIALADYDRMHDEQGGLCFLCGQPEVGRRLSVDHNHTTGEVRRLLCARCNFMVGVAETNPGLVEKIEAYLGRRD